MVFKTSTHFLKQFSSRLVLHRVYKSEYVYEMPEALKNCFYLANASLFDNTNWFIHRAYEVIFQDLTEEVKNREPSLDAVKAVDKVLNFFNVIQPCSAVLDLRYPVEKTNGQHSIVRAFRAQHGKYRAGIPCLGGLTLSTQVCKDMMKALAALATYRYACLGIEMNGSHGGIKICKTDYTQEELKKIVQTYILELINKASIGESIDAIEPDMNCGYEEIGWISELDVKLYDESTITRSIVGKPSFLGGLENYESAGAHFAFFTIHYFLNHQNVLEKVQCRAGLRDRTFIIQGIGKLGSQIASLLENAGAKCVGVKEHDAYVYDDRGICVKDIVDYKNRKGGIEHFNPKTKPRQDSEILTQDCDILVLCAGMKTLSCYTAENVKAKIIVEAAHGAITPSAHQILIDRRKLVLPDILVSCGYSLAAHYEYLKTSQFFGKSYSRSLTKNIFKDLLHLGQKKSKARITGQSILLVGISSFNESKMVFESMEYVISQIFRDVLKKTEKYNLGLDLRTAAFVKSTHSLFRTAYLSKSISKK